MGDDRAAGPDYNAIMNLYAFGIVIIKVNVIADNYLAADLTPRNR